MEHVWANAPLAGILHLHWNQQPISTDDKYPCFLQIWFLLYTHIMLSFKWPNPPNSQSVKVVIYNPFPIYIIYISLYILPGLIDTYYSPAQIWGDSLWNCTFLGKPCGYHAMQVQEVIAWVQWCSHIFVQKWYGFVPNWSFMSNTSKKQEKPSLPLICFFAPMGFTPGIQATTPTHSLLLEAGHCAYLLGSCWTETGCKILRHGGSPCQVNC